MSGESMRTRGLDGLIADLAKLEGPAVKKLARSSLRAGAKVIQKAAKAAAPRRSGKLASKISVRSAGSRGGKIGVKVTTSGADGAYQEEFGFQRVPFFQVEGGQIRSRPAGTEPRTAVPGLHWMRNAADTVMEAAIDAFAADAGRRIQEALAGGKT